MVRETWKLGEAGAGQRRARKIIPSVLNKTSLSWEKELYGKLMLSLPSPQTLTGCLDIAAVC